MTAIGSNFFRLGRGDQAREQKYMQANGLDFQEGKPGVNKAQVLTHMSDGALNGKALISLFGNKEAAENVADGFGLEFSGNKIDDMTAITNAALGTTGLEANNTIRYGRLQAADAEKLGQLGVTDNGDGSYSRTNIFDDTITLSADKFVVEGVVDEDNTAKMENIFGEGAFAGEQGGNSILSVNYHTGEGDLYSENHASQGSWYENHQAIHGRTLSDDTINSGAGVKIDDINESVYNDV